MALDDRQARQRVARIEDLLGQADSLPEPARVTVLELVTALVELYGAGLARITEAVSQVDGLLRHLAADELVSHLLVMHGLHPLDAPARVGEALDRIRPRLQGAQVELVEIEQPVVRLKLSGAKGCRSTATRIVAELEEAILAAAPEFERVEVGQAAPAAALIPVESLMVRARGER